jgi:ribonuclease HII
VERRLLRDGAGLLASMDEVGRGAPAGPVAVGVVVIHASTPPAPSGVRDSKLLTAPAREALVPAVERWAADAAVGTATADEVDAFGVVGALRLAGQRALAALVIRPDLVLLDGSHDWMTDPDPVPGATGVPVVTRVKADLTCASVAAASILAKVHRDAMMTGLDLEYPGYGLAVNKGYGTADHLAALQRLGPTPQHRVSWRLPGGA